jgi:hypothetical protein
MPSQQWPPHPHAVAAAPPERSEGEGVQAVSPRRVGFLGPNGVEPMLGAKT